MTEVDFLLTNAILLTMDAQFNVYEPGALAVSGENILAVGSEKEITSSYHAANTIDCGGKVLMPGLVNSHTHVPMSLLRGLADDLRLDVWLMGYMMPVEREFVSPDFVYLGTQLSCAEMIRSGVTAFADMYYFEESVARAAADAGMRAVCSQTVLKFPTPDAHTFEDSLALAREFIKEWKGHHLIVPSVAPHAPYTCTPEILRATAELAAEFDVPLHTHLAETSFEVDNMRKDQGMPVIPYVKKQGLFEAKVLAAHCVHVDEGEMRTMLHAGAGVAHNPSSNLKLASGAAPVKRMMELGLNVGIGTDGPASNNDLDMFEEIRLAAFLAKGTSGDPTALPARTTLMMATRMGAEAMHIGDVTGSLETGKRADLILVDISPLHNSPHFHHDNNATYAQIVYAGHATDVTDVMVNGIWLMRNRDLLTLDEKSLLQNSQEYARKIDIFLMQREQSVLSKLIAIGGAMEEESFEVQTKIQIHNPQKIIEQIEGGLFEIVRRRHYRQYDAYFSFEDPDQGHLRYREDQTVEKQGETTSIRSRLTLLGPAREYSFPQKVLLSRSRYLAPATQTLRFYKEYFKPSKMDEIEKDRYRYLVKFREIEFFINVDQLTQPDLGAFLEIKSRTWSRKDANQKAKLAAEMIAMLGASPDEAISKDYIEMIST